MGRSRRISVSALDSRGRPVQLRGKLVNRARHQKAYLRGCAGCGKTKLPRLFVSKAGIHELPSRFLFHEEIANNAAETSIPANPTIERLPSGINLRLKGMLRRRSGDANAP
jgi:hypothetical protein